MGTYDDNMINKFEKYAEYNLDTLYIPLSIAHLAESVLLKIHDFFRGDVLVSPALRL